MDILIVPASLDLLHQWKGNRIPNNSVLAIGGEAWVKAIIKIATKATEELGQQLHAVIFDKSYGVIYGLIYGEGWRACLGMFMTGLTHV